MNVDSILISEYATADSHSSLTVLRTFHVLQATSFPARIGMMTVSAIVHAHLSDAGTEHTLKLVLINEKREQLRTLLDTKFRLGTPNENHPAGVPLRHVIIHRAVNAEFPHAGAYAVELFIDGTYHAAASIGIIPPGE